MKRPLSALALAGCAVLVNAQTASTVSENLVHTHSSFDLIVRAPYADAAPLFGPEGERAWAGQHWDPRFIHPSPPRDEQGAVFTVNHGPLNAVWVTTCFDFEDRHFQYVSFLPGMMVTTVDVRFKPLDAESTRVTVVYTRTALSGEGGRHVLAMTAGDRRAGSEWQQAIDAYLAVRKRGPTSLPNQNP
jgi:hypothetical protein